MRVTEEWLRRRLAKSDNLKPETEVVQPCDRPKAAQRKAPPKALKLTMYEPPEADVLPSVLEALQYHPAVAVAWRCNNAAGKLLRADGTHSQFMRFGLKDSSDIHGHMCNGLALYVETKKRSGASSAGQIDFIENAKACGCVAFFARSVDDVWRELGK